MDGIDVAATLNFNITNRERYRGRFDPGCDRRVGRLQVFLIVPRIFFPTVSAAFWRVCSPETAR
jgi:hypothetical protein